MISICIPAWEMRGKGVELLTRCLDSIMAQTYKDYEIIVSDNSQYKEIYELCQKYPVKYFYNPKRGMAANTNNALIMASGELFKILYQDDYFADENSLQDIMDNFGTSTWLISGCSNNPHPYWNKDVPTGKNTLGSPSCLTMKYKVQFNESLKWILDCELYGRLYHIHGWPKILDKINIIMGEGEWQETNNLTEEEKLKELINAKE